MYENIGKKFMLLAKVVFYIGTAICIILGLYFLFKGSDFVLTGLLLMIVGPIITWVATWGLYAFGQLVDDVEKIRSQGKKVAVVSSERSTIMKKKDENTEIELEEPKDVIAKSLVMEKEATYFSTTEKDTIICSKCKFEQPSGRKICWRCGARFEEK